MKKFLSIEFPGYIQNKEEAVNNLGGIKSIENILNSNKIEDQLLPLYFTNNSNSKKLNNRPIYGDHKKTKNLLIKVTRKKTNLEENNKFLKSEIIGIIDNTYYFQGMADFQYSSNFLNLEKKESIFDIIMKDDNEFLSFKSSEPIILPPPIFSKIDKPQHYEFKLNRQIKIEDIKDTENEDFLRMKQKLEIDKYRHAPIYMNFNSQEEVPKEPPNDIYKDKLNEKELELEKKIKELLHIRPIWSTQAICATLNEPKSKKITIILRRFAYYFNDGPWRRLWVRLGYDPRKNPESKIWQVIDFRINPEQIGTLSSEKNKFISVTPKRLKKSTGSSSNEILNELELEYTFSSIPTRLHTLYQLCDLKDEKIQELIHNSENVEKKCDEKTGWFSKKIIKSIILQMKAKLPYLDKNTSHNAEKMINNEENISEDSSDENSEIIQHIYSDEELNQQEN